MHSLKVAIFIALCTFVVGGDDYLTIKNIEGGLPPALLCLGPLFNITVSWNCSGVENTAVGQYDKAAAVMLVPRTYVINSFWSSETISVTSAISYNLTWGPYLVEEVYDCTKAPGYWCRGVNTFAVASTYITSYIPLPEVTKTDSVCEGSDGTITRFTTGSVAGTSTVTTCALSISY